MYVNVAGLCFLGTGVAKLVKLSSIKIVISISIIIGEIKQKLLLKIIPT